MTMQAVEPVVRSPFGRPDVPEGGLSALVLRHSPGLGERPALIDAPSARTITYGQLGTLVRRAAAGLAARGFGQGDVLALYSPNLPEYAVAVHAALSLGGVVTTANPLYTAEELARQLEDSGARTLITVPPFVEPARAAGLRGRDRVRRGRGGHAVRVAARARRRASARAGRPGGTRPSSRTRAAPPGLPKGVVLTHGAVAANVLQTGQLIDYGESDTIVAVAPFFHAVGFTVLLNAGAGLRSDGRLAAPLRAGDLPRRDPGPSRHRDGRGPADRTRAGPSSRGRPVRPLEPALRRLRRRAAGGGAAAGGGGPARLHRRPGLRDDRDHGRHRHLLDGRARAQPPRAGRDPPRRHRGPRDRAGDRRRPGHGRDRRDLGARAAAHARLSQQRRGHGRHDRRRRLAAHRRHRPRRRARAGCSSPTASRS